MDAVVGVCDDIDDDDDDDEEEEDDGVGVSANTELLLLKRRALLERLLLTLPADGLTEDVALVGIT